MARLAGGRPCSIRRDPSSVGTPKPPESNLADLEWAADSTRPAAPDPRRHGAGFVLLGERPGCEIALGTVVQPWKAVTDNVPPPQVDAEGFAASISQDS